LIRKYLAEWQGTAGERRAKSEQTTREKRARDERETSQRRERNERETSQRREIDEPEAREKRGRDEPERKAREKRAVGESAEERLAKRRPAGCAALSIDWGMAGLPLQNRKACRGGQAFSVFLL
jgi:hypothetical protein